MSSYVVTPSPLIAVVMLIFVAILSYFFKLYRTVQIFQGRLASIDGLRGILALSVFAHHFAITYQYVHTGSWSPPVSGFYNLLGSGGVIMFFMITGFLFFGKIRAVRGRMNMNSFFVGRIFRIMPLYIVSVLIVYMLSAAETGFPFHDRVALSTDGWLVFTATPIDGNGHSTLMNAGVQWTLAYEWFFYLSIPAVGFVWRKLENQSWCLFYALVLIVLLAHNVPIIPFTNLNTMLLVPFVLGGLAGEIGRLKHVRTVAMSKIGGVFIVSLGVLIVIFFDTAYSLTSMLFLFFCFTPIALGNTVFGLLQTKTAIFLGEVSYSIYLLHGIVLYTIFHFVMPASLAAAHSNGRLLSLILIASACVLGVSTLSYLIIERPALRFGRKFLAIDRVQTIAAP